jgi:DNA-binding PadR family transcriptional regulator
MDLSVLDLYILSMIDRGCQTPYHLHREGGLSLGASSPALARLLKAKLVARLEEENANRRPRHQYTLTAQGRRMARTGWQPYLSGARPPNDLDSVLRIADMSAYYKGERSQIVRLLKSVGDQRMIKAEQSSLRLRNSELIIYARLRDRCDAARLAAEGSALIGISKELTIKETNKGKRTSRPALK